MISMQHITALVLRHVRLFGEMNRLIWLFYWPALDMFLFGFTSVWIQKAQPGTTGIEVSMLAGIVFWQLLSRANFDVSICLIEELWSLNMLNLFATPLRFAEFICAVMILSGIMSVAVTVYCLTAVWFIYGVNLLVLGVKVLPFLLALFLSGLALGFFAASIIIYFGIRAESIVFMLGWLFAPFCGALYPIEILPWWAQYFSFFLPMTPAFEGIRLLVQTQTLSSYYVVMSLSMSVCYYIASLTYFAYMFDRSKQRGFARLTSS